MKILYRHVLLFLIVALNIFFALSSCHSSGANGEITRDSLIKHAPVLSPEQFIKHTNIEQGFELQLVASEPDVIAPVSMDFDNQNRIWVVEMTAYMPDIEGDGENVPDGKVVILEDANNDGYYEKRKVFLDSLRLPRSIAFVNDGILVAEPPNLWYFQIKNDMPFNKELVDPEFAVGDNVEAQANGLIRATDNWIYNAGSNKRYMKTDTGWVIEKTHFRGQWGITQDDDGRLFYNNNSQNLLGDYFLPGLGNDNSNLQVLTGFNERIVKDNSTYPSRPTPGVNRGYLSSEVDESFKLKRFTAACGPVLYRGTLFGKDYYQNAFVAEPAGNLIKRNILHFNPTNITGEQAYKKREFIASDDERFRPVNLYNGPDGALYIVDMYRGVIQYKLMMTKYLKNEIKQRDLEKPLNCGRIYRVVPKGTRPLKFVMPDSPLELTDLFKNQNSWQRERAQQILVGSKPAMVIEPLKKMVDNPKNFREFIHALWTLKGMHAVSDQELIQWIITSTDTRKLIQLYSALDSVGNLNLKKPFLEKTYSLMKDSAMAPYIAFKSYIFKGYGNDVFDAVVKQLILTNPTSAVVAQAIISNLENQERNYLSRLNKDADISGNALILEALKNVIDHIERSKNVPQAELLKKKYGRGISMFKTTCQPCHGDDGEGIKNLAPPLNNSQWVTGNKEDLISIVLYGLIGPVSVNHKVYDVPDVSGEMPAQINNPEMVEPDLALLLSYIRNNWNNKADDIHLDDIKKVKSKFGGRSKPFTTKELLREK